VPHTGTYEIRVRDLAPHDSPPAGGTDDTGDPKAFTHNITWVVPPNLTAQHIQCNQYAGYPKDYHYDIYTVTLSRPNNVSFKGLWIAEKIEESSDPCHVLSDFDIGTGQINQANQYGDQLGDDGPWYESHPGCLATATQTIYLRESQNAEDTQYTIRQNMIYWTFSPGSGYDDFVSKLVTGNTAKCPDYPN